VEKWNKELKTGKTNLTNHKTYGRVSIKLHPTNNSYFPSGQAYVSMRQAEKDNVLLVHNNWIEGHSRKLTHFQNWTLWHWSGKLDQMEIKCDVAKSAVFDSNTFDMDKQKSVLPPTR
jgi:hypothetical protein